MPVIHDRHQNGGCLSISQATAIAAYLSELMIFSMASTGVSPMHCMTWRNTAADWPLTS